MALALAAPMPPAAEATSTERVVVLPGASSAEGIAAGRGSTFYAGDYTRGDIFRGDVRRRAAELFIDVPAGRQALGMVVDRSHHLPFVAGGATGQAYGYDLDTGATSATYQLAPPDTSIINDVTLTRHGGPAHRPVRRPAGAGDGPRRRAVPARVAAAVFGLPASELVDLTLALDEVWGPAAVDLGERVAGAAAPEVALRVVQDWLVARRVEAPDPLVSEVVRRSMPWRADPVAVLGDQLGISESQLRRRCLAAVGIGPKALQRTLRFQGFLALTQAAGMRPPSPDDGGLAGLAAHAGYADHAHLTRECVRLVGLAPRAFLGSSRCDCGHGHAASYLPFLQGGMHDSFKPAGAVAS